MAIASVPRAHGRKTHPKLRVVTTPSAPESLDSGLGAINIVDQELDQAHATLDLLMTLAEEAGEDAADSGLGLCSGSFIAALNGAMLRIERAKEAAEELHKTALASAKQEVRS